MKSTHTMLFYPFIEAAVICVLSTLALVINMLFFKYPGNNYFPPNIIILAILLTLMYIGCHLQFQKNTAWQKEVLREIIYFFLVMCLLTLVTNAAQYTPFHPIDKQLLILDGFLHVNIAKAMAWTAIHPTFKQILTISYESLPYQMSILPLFMIINRHFNPIREYYSLMLIAAILGFSFYYFLPTMAPAAIIASPYFLIDQHMTGIKFLEIHHHTKPTSLDGGMISFPSFHVIWAWFCLYLVRGIPLIFYTLLPINILLVTACFFLGWHYLIDLIGSILSIAITHYFHTFRKTHA